MRGRGAKGRVLRRDFEKCVGGESTAEPRSTCGIGEAPLIAGCAGFGKAQNEHIGSALPQTANADRIIRFARSVPTRDNIRRLLEPEEQRWLGCKQVLLWSYERFDGLGFSNAARLCRLAPFRRPEISFSQGDKWNALINRYITVIPFIGDDPCIAMQSMSGWTLKKPVHKAMIAKVGAAARPSHWAMPGAALPPPEHVSTS